ncbi:hypothetical protein V2W30_26785 [Streptomyces sp. Q6]|uniref:Uncharacterized protein n=1 Tax=Streptomyces citrinus TaxID=3118173 RepID=A0ACD5AH75_9ACTN
MRPRLTLLRSALVAAAVGGAVLVPTAAFADGRPPAEPGHEQPAAQSPEDVSANPFFLAAGGGMAAAGAAGLVYSTVRRGRADA